MVIDHDTGVVYTNNSIPVREGWEYKLMSGKGDDRDRADRLDGRQRRTDVRSPIKQGAAADGLTQKAPTV